MSGDGEVTVRGGATAEELGAVLAVLAMGTGGDRGPVGYELWRRNRLRVMRAETGESRVRTSR